jgi:hypothetical protein
LLAALAERTFRLPRHIRPGTPASWIATLNEMIAAASALAGPEKTGLHALLIANPQVIDVEVAFRGVPAAPRVPKPNANDKDEISRF